MNQLRFVTFDVFKEKKAKDLERALRRYMTEEELASHYLIGLELFENLHHKMKASRHFHWSLVEREDQQVNAGCLPPPAAERLLSYLLPRAKREIILGDLEEDYRTNFLPKFGPREARWMYWSHAIRSVAPMLVRLSALAGLLGWLWRKLGS